MPFIGPSAAAFIAAWIASFVMGRSVWNVRSMTLASAVGTRIDCPSNLPLSTGMTSESAFAAPVDEGIMLMAAARARRRVGGGGSCGGARAPRPPQPPFGVGDVEHGLVVRVRVHRGHQAVLD